MYTSSHIPVVTNAILIYKRHCIKQMLLCKILHGTQANVGTNQNSNEHLHCMYFKHVCLYIMGIIHVNEHHVVDMRILNSCVMEQYVICIFRICCSTSTIFSCKMCYFLIIQDRGVYSGYSSLMMTRVAGLIESASRLRTILDVYSATCVHGIKYCICQMQL